MNLTPIEWLIKKLSETGLESTLKHHPLNDYIKKAKAKEKKAIIDAFEEGQKQVINLEGNWYYEQNYK